MNTPCLGQQQHGSAGTAQNLPNEAACDVSDKTTVLSVGYAINFAPHSLP
jgi:hypothetical protein